MSQFVTAFHVGVVATVLVCSNALMPAPAGAAPMSDADKGCLETGHRDMPGAGQGAGTV